MKINKIFHTVRYMNTRQVYYRLKYILYKKIKRKIKSKKYKSINEEYVFKNYENIADEFKEEIVIKADGILNNEFTFLNNLSYKFTGDIKWNCNIFDYRLWNFNLNYFDYLDTLSIAYSFTNNLEYIDKGIELINSWILANSKYFDEDIWDPYVISKRIYNIINFISFNKKNINFNKNNKINESIYTQAKYLSKNIEYFIDANHVIMDAKGLIFAGVYFDDKKLLAKGFRILLKEYKRQVLDDGAHYEKSPSYQVEVLSHYVECYILLNKNNYKNYGIKLINIIDKMSEYLSNIMLPNGNIPLINDSSLDYPFNANDLLQIVSVIINKRLFYSEKISNYVLSLLDKLEIEEYYKLTLKKRKKAYNIQLESSGYYIIRDEINKEEIYFLFDCGDLGPDYNLGHAHADSLNVLLNVGGKDLLIDSGTYTYKVGEDRNRYRSTIAHNTICIDNISSSQIWGGFRVAKRAKTKLLKYYEEENFIYISAKHDGYKKVLNKDKIIHKREVIYIRQKAIVIIDTIYGKIKSQHNAIINFNINKENYSIDNSEFRTFNNSIKFLFDSGINILDSRYSEKFSEEKEGINIQLCWEFDSDGNKVTILAFNNSKITYKISNDLMLIFEKGDCICTINR